MALASAFRNPPDLVVTDVMMPGLDGFGLLQRTSRQREDRCRIPVILLSARAGEEARVRKGISAGADDYLTKPFSAGELLARVETTLHLDRVRREGTPCRRRGRREHGWSALEAARMVVWEWELSSGKLTFSPNAPEVIGAPVEFDIDSRACRKFISDDAVLAAQRLMKKMQTRDASRLGTGFALSARIDG